MANGMNICEHDNYDDFKIKTCSDLFRFIELRLREARGIRPIKRTASKEDFLRNSYDEALSFTIKLRRMNRQLTKPPQPTGDYEDDLIFLRDWCADPLRQALYPKKREMAQRSGEIAYILDENPNIRIKELAEMIGVSIPTISRNKVWQKHKKLPPRKQFPDKIKSPHQIKPHL